MEIKRFARLDVYELVMIYPNLTTVLCNRAAFSFLSPACGFSLHSCRSQLVDIKCEFRSQGAGLKSQFWNWPAERQWMSPITSAVASPSDEIGQNESDLAV